jgi:hypothetical protein
MQAPKLVTHQPEFAENFGQVGRWGGANGGSDPCREVLSLYIPGGGHAFRSFQIVV